MRRGELDIATMPLHEVADEYLEILAQLPEIDVEEAGEFLLVASLLVDLKVKRLEVEFGRRGSDANSDEPESPEIVPDDPAMQLTQALLRYQRVRDAAAELRDLGRAAAGRRPRQSPQHVPGSEPGLDLEDAHVGDLVLALRSLVERVDLRRVGDHVIEFDEVPMETLQSELIANLRRSTDQVMPLQTTFADRPAPWRVGMFCATLELVRTQVVMVRQANADDIIEVRLRPDEASAPDPSSQSELELLPPAPGRELEDLPQPREHHLGHVVLRGVAVVRKGREQREIEGGGRKSETRVRWSEHHRCFITLHHGGLHGPETFKCEARQGPVRRYSSGLGRSNARPLQEVRAGCWCR